MERLPDALDPADERPAVAEALRDWLALQHALALQPAGAIALLRRTGHPRAALRLSRSTARPPPRAIEAAVEALRRSGAVAVPFFSPLYPARLANLADPAPLLLIRGEPRALAGPGVAVVGSRAASAYGLAVAQRLSAELARAGLVVISGLARGVDAAAHRGALEAGGLTVAFQACGPDRVYPSAHRELARRIERQGAVVTEFPPGTRPLRQYFPLRNRLISGLARALVVVEARERSGSLITAAHALDQGIDVLAVPGPVTAPTSVGPNRLIRDGAFVALEAADVVEVIGPGAASPSQRVVRTDPHGVEAVGEAGGRILRALLHEPATRDELGRRLGRAPEQLALDLLELELAGRVVEDRDGRLRVVSPQPGARA